ncbi:hypothetical protein WUBG_17943, partial [Wuchereria bancrofti]
MNRTCHIDDEDVQQCGSCIIGYQPLNGRDECVENRHSCDPSNSICVNTVGGYTCVCSLGYEGVGGVCVDVNECERGVADCNVPYRCENHLGSVGCKCPPGFIGNGVHCIEIESFTKADSDCNDEWKKTCQDMNRTCHIDDEDVLTVWL